MVLSSVVMGQFTFRYGLPPSIAILCGFAVGALCGWINGALVAYMKLPPFIVTLGMWQIVLASNFLYSANETIRAQDIETQAPILQFFGNNFRMGNAVFTYGVVAMVLLVAILWYVLNHTAWGRHVYAIGDDPALTAVDVAALRAVMVKASPPSGGTSGGRVDWTEREAAAEKRGFDLGEDKGYREGYSDGWDDAIARIKGAIDTVAPDAGNISQAMMAPVQLPATT